VHEQYAHSEELTTELIGSGPRFPPKLLRVVGDFRGNGLVGIAVGCVTKYTPRPWGLADGFGPVSAERQGPAADEGTQGSPASVSAEA
jgi:hypothetical protein